MVVVAAADGGDGDDASRDQIERVANDGSDGIPFRASGASAGWVSGQARHPIG